MTCKEKIQIIYNLLDKEVPEIQGISENEAKQILDDIENAIDNFLMT